MSDILEDSILLIKDFEPMALEADPRGYCVNSSFGKDSMALIEIFKRSGVKFFVKWNITGIDPPELVYFARNQLKKLESLGITCKPQMYSKGESMRGLIIKHKTPPTRIIRYCCDFLKEKQLPENIGCFHSFGVRKAEGTARQGRNELEVLHKNKKKRLSLEYSVEEQTSLYLFNDNTDNRRQFERCVTKGIRAVNPLVYWSDRQLWDYIRSENLDYCSLYDDGFSRLGCIGCPMAREGRKQEFKRYPKFYDYYLHAFDKMLERRTADKVDEKRIAEGKLPMPWKTAQDVMDWWLEDNVELDGQEFVEGW